MINKIRVDVIIREYWKGEYLVILPNGYPIKCTECNFPEILQIVYDWLEQPYSGSSRGVNPSSICEVYHPIIATLHLDIHPRDVASKALSYLVRSE